MKPYQRLVTQASTLSGSSNGTTEYTLAPGNPNINSDYVASRINNGVQAIAPRTSESLAAGSAATVVSTQSQGSVAQSSSNHASAIPQNMAHMGIMPMNPGQLGTAVPAHSATHNMPVHTVNFQLPNYVANPSLTTADFSRSLNEKRRGKWTEEEKAYADRLIEEFKEGTLSDCENNTTLRSYLMKKLHCDKPMRITKKYSGEKIGKLVFVAKPRIRRASETQNRPTLEELERRFYKSVLGSNMEAGAKMAFAMIQAGCYGYSQPQPTLGQPQLQIPHQAHAPSYNPSMTLNAASQPTPYTSFGQPITMQPPSVTPAWGGSAVQPQSAAPAGGVPSIPGNAADTTNALQQSFLDALSESKDDAKTPCSNGHVAPQTQQESLTETNPQTGANTQGRIGHNTGPEQEMDMHKLIPSLLREASSLMSPMGAGNGGQPPLACGNSQSIDGFSSASQDRSAAQVFPGQPFAAQPDSGTQSNSVLDSQPQQQTVRIATEGHNLSGIPKPAPTGTPNSAATHVYPSPMTAEEYAISAQQTAIAVSQHSAYSFCEPQTFSDRPVDSHRARKHDQVSAAFLREHHKRQCLESFAAGDSVLTGNANIVSASEKSSEMGTESESAIASSDFGSDNGSDNSES